MKKKSTIAAIVLGVCVMVLGACLSDLHENYCRQFGDVSSLVCPAGPGVMMP